MSSIGSNIKRLREKYGLSQSELGKIAGVTDKAVSTWELGLKEPRMGAIQKLSDYFHITKSSIIDGDIKSAPFDEALVSNSVLNEALLGLSDDDLDDVVEYVRFLKTRRDKKQ